MPSQSRYRRCPWYTAGSIYQAYRVATPTRTRLFADLSARGRTSRPAWVVCLSLFLGAGVWAESEVVDPDPATRPEPDLVLPEMDDLGSLLWDTSGSLRVEAGYKDNPQLSSVNPVGSGFAAAGGDFMFYRLPLDGVEFSLFGELEHIEYFESGLEPETLGILDVRVKRTEESGWNWGGAFEYLFLNQVFDASDLEGVPTIVRAQGHTLAMRPMVGRDLGRGWHIEAEGEGSRQWLAAPLDGFWDGGGKLSVRYERSKLSEFGLFYRHRDRFFDRRSPVDVDGTPLEGTLRFAQHEVEASWQRTWTTNGVWRTTLRSGYLRNGDNGGGHYDYDRYLWALGVRCRWSKWELRADLRARWYLYGQPGLGSVLGEDRKRFDLTYSFRAEYRAAKKLKAYLHFEHESSDESSSLADYRLNSISAGLVWDL